MPAFQTPCISAEVKAGTQTDAKTRTAKIGIVITQSDPETVFNVFRLANYALNQRDEVSIFLLGRRYARSSVIDEMFPTTMSYTEETDKWRLSPHENGMRIN